MATIEINGRTWTSLDGPNFTEEQFAEMRAWEKSGEHVAPAPPVTPGLLAAAQAVVADADLRRSRFDTNATCIFVDKTVIDTLRTELAAATAGPVALTADGIARAFRAGELDWYLEYAPHVGTQCAVFDDMNARSQAATIAGAEAVLAIVRRTA